MRQHPPLNWRSLFWEPHHVYEIASAYYEAVLPRSEEAWYDLARGVFSLIRSSGAPVESSVLGVSVAIETLVDATFPELKETSADFKEEIENFRARLTGLEEGY